MSENNEPPNVAEKLNRCRICLIDHGCMTSLQNDCVEAKLKDLIKCTCIDIKYEKNLPEVVCHVCLYKLNMWSEFKERFVQSNKVLLEQLEIPETSDNAIKDSSKDESCTAKDAERKRRNSETNISNIDKKKSRIDTALSEVANNTCDTGQIILDTIWISSDNDNDHDRSDLSKSIKNGKSGEEDEDGKMYSGPTRARLLPSRRGRNIERRKASTKRWVERKKALLAATGENVSDTDSIGSDDMQMSPVQKARAKTNADKELERQKKVAKVLKKLETNLTEKYKCMFDREMDFDAPRTRSKELHSSASQQRHKDSLLNQMKNIIQRNGSSLDSSMERENSLTPLTDNVTLEAQARKFKKLTDDETFTSRSMKAELMLGDITFAVTSTLVLVDPSNHNHDKMDFNNITKDSKNPSPDESNREKNTDIIDAVQLRRINPVTTNANSKANNLVQRCLSIEVESNEFALLKGVQYELTNFVEKEMKPKLLGISDNATKTDRTDSAKTDNICFRNNLDQKLKDMIELVIKKNVEPSILSQVKDVCSQGSRRFSQSLIKMSMNSPKYQPKVMIKRLDITKESKYYNINNNHALKPRNKLAGPFSMINRKRQIVPPVRYTDYSITALDSDSEGDDVSDNNDDNIDDGDFNLSDVRINSRAMAKRQSAVIINKSMENKQNGQKANHEKVSKIESAIAENHICGVCGLTFHSRNDVEEHVRTHKTSTVQIALENDNTNLQKLRQGKQKMMRCKRCHEIVEARLVRAHVCKTLLHKCYVCDSMFHTKNLLAKHLESHDHSEFKITNAIGNKKLENNTESVLKALSTAKPQKDQGTETATKIKPHITINDIQSDKISSTGVKLDGTENTMKKPKETYTCFVCDKIFTDEEVLKDHLQQHCDDLSEGEQSNSKEQYQCAICGSTLESDQALEEHVGKHLFDDEDDNPNLISIDQSNEDKLKETEIYQCGQCSETFDSEILLEMHMQGHEEEVEIAEWENQGLNDCQYQCILCDELFNTEEELAQHLDIHNANAQICQLCDKPFRTLEDLQKHVATH